MDIERDVFEGNALAELLREGLDHDDRSLDAAVLRGVGKFSRSRNDFFGDFARVCVP